jgi:hypothetical protein
MVVEGRRDQRRPPGPVGIRRSSSETSTKGRRFEGTPAGVEKVSSEDSIAASSLVRWSGSAAVLGGLSTVFVDEVILFHRSKLRGE